ncbi:MAG: hypothetical protein PVH53_05355 [Desulfobacterales bacterium]
MLEKAKNKPEPLVWIDDAPKAVGHPDDTDIAELKKMLSELFIS